MKRDINTQTGDSYTTKPSRDSTHGANLVSSSPTMLQRILYGSIFPAVIIVPIWFAIGRAFFGAGGWMVFYTIPGAAVVVLPYQLLIMVLVLMTKKRYLSRRASGALLLYYALHVILQITLVDGGDTRESVGSVLTFVGVPGHINNILFGVSQIAIVIVMVWLAVAIGRDANRKRRPERSFTGRS